MGSGHASVMPYIQGPWCSMRRFQLLNQRFPIVFYYFYNISDTDGSSPSYTSAGVIGASTPIAVNGNTPTQGHLSFTNVTGCAHCAAAGFSMSLDLARRLSSTIMHWMMDWYESLTLAWMRPGGGGSWGDGTGGWRQCSLHAQP